MGPGYGQQFLNQHSVSAARTPVFDFLGKKNVEKCKQFSVQNTGRNFSLWGGGSRTLPLGSEPPWHVRGVGTPPVQEGWLVGDTTHSAVP